MQQNMIYGKNLSFSELIHKGCLWMNKVGQPLGQLLTIRYY